MYRDDSRMVSGELSLGLASVRSLHDAKRPFFSVDREGTVAKKRVTVKTDA
jgi:hypothetical protein